MRPWVFVLAAVLPWLPPGATARPRPEPGQPPEWLAGCWAAVRGQTLIEEQWTVPRAGAMLGLSRTTRGEAMVEHEFLLLRATPAGLVYRAHPSRQAPAEFTAPAGMAAGDSVVFDNPAHDFPQRIGYRRIGADSVTAWIEGPRQGTRARIEFRYGRVGCEGA